MYNEKKISYAVLLVAICLSASVAAQAFHNYSERQSFLRTVSEFFAVSTLSKSEHNQRLNSLEIVVSSIDRRIQTGVEQIMLPKVSELNISIAALEDRAKTLVIAEVQMQERLTLLNAKLAEASIALDDSIKLVNKHEEQLQRIKPTEKRGGLVLDSNVIKTKPKGLFSVPLSK